MEGTVSGALQFASACRQLYVKRAAPMQVRSRASQAAEKHVVKEFVHSMSKVVFSSNPLLQARRQTAS